MTEQYGQRALSIIIVSYNTRELTLDCLRSLHAQTDRSLYELIVVDNCSSDGSADAIAHEFPDARLVRSPANLGFAGANNVAAREATGTYLLLLNPDTVVLDRAVERLLAFAQRTPDAGIWGGRTQFADGRLNPASCWAKPGAWSLFCIATGLAKVFRTTTLFNPEAFGGWDRSTERQVDIVSGCFLMLRRELWESLGGFDPAFFMYGEEADLCLRAGAQGVRPRVTPDATIIHYGGASEKARADKLVRLFRAKRLLFERHLTPASRWWCTRMLDVWVWTRLSGAMIARMLGRGTAAWKTWAHVRSQSREWHGPLQPGDSR
ncbi:MAG: glycosyltransferase family 2 protein [Phycisphaerae bacterium]|nr:glycosyltransferase family 2 protein [Phycisphaerae bacterium]